MAELITALDFETYDEATNFVAKAGNSIEWYKVGSILFTRCGRELVETLKKKRKKIFLDLKYHDIPNTVAEAVRAAIELGADMINVHASGGAEMMAAAVKEVKKSGSNGASPFIIAVTVLTSFDDISLKKTLNASESCTAASHALYLAKLAHESGMDGVVCSAHEIESIKKFCGSNFITVVPGIRPLEGRKPDDQKRVMAPGDAVMLGADFLVVGRPILKADDPVAVAIKIKEEIATASKNIEH